MVDNNPFLPGGLADRSKRVLIVDDDENIRAYLSSLLIENGYLVSLAASLDEVKPALARDAYDLVVIGLVFLGQPYGGLEIIEYIKSVQPDTYAIILTSYPSTQTAIQALRLKVADYLIKPVFADELLRSVVEYCVPRTLNSGYWYDSMGNIAQMSPSAQFAGEVLNYANVFVASPFVAASVIPQSATSYLYGEL